VQEVDTHCVAGKGAGVGRAHGSYEAEFAAEAASVAAAGEFVRGHLSSHGLWYLVEDVRLVVSELATNALLHAQTPFTVTLAEHDHSVLLTVRDRSHERPVQTIASVLDPGARGIFVVAQVSSNGGVTAPVDASHGSPSGRHSIWPPTNHPADALKGDRRAIGPRTDDRNHP